MTAPHRATAPALSAVAVTVAFGIPTFVGAFLLLEVQPMVARFVLPKFGGSTSVWSTCLVFFQGLLFFGYLYAHLLSTHFKPRTQAVIHMVVLGTSLLLLPLAPGRHLGAAMDGAEHTRILQFLGAAVGLPYLVLSTTGPLLQRWFALRSTKSPYFLYSLSNLGSMLGLLCYPVIFEPTMRLSTQTSSWSAVYAFFTAAVGVSAVQLIRAGKTIVKAPSTAAPTGANRLNLRTRSLVLLLALVASLLMAATTQHLTSDVAAVPFLWVLPLSLYLLTFVICFGREDWYQPRRTEIAVLISAVALTATLYWSIDMGVLSRIGIHCGALFVLTYACHGEVARLKPAPTQLTEFYLLVSAGGVLGTIFVSFCAPLIFEGFWELHVGVGAVTMLLLVLRYREKPLDGASRRLQLVWACRILALLAIVGALRWHTMYDAAGAVWNARNFYGVLRVVQHVSPSGKELLELSNGGVLHGNQFVDEELAGVATTYYGKDSGLTLFINAQRTEQERLGRGPELNVAIIGLGIGTIAALAEPKDRLTFYELDPAVGHVARSRFSYLSRTKAAATDVVIGDGRLSLQEEGQRSDAERFDLLVVDAFTGDAIPVHLLTQECFRVYRSRLRAGGAIVVHISNRYLDLSPVIRGIAKAEGWQSFVLSGRGRPESNTVPSRWAVLMPKNNGQIERLRRIAEHQQPDAPSVLWTDDFSNVLTLIQ